MVRLHDGKRVPWVTRWSDEVVRTPFQLGQLADGSTYLTYADERPEDRDQYGVLWMREIDSPTGEPLFSQVSTLRQRRSMIEGLCQVCGLEIPEEPIQWLMVENQATRLPTGELLTISPPTCASCVTLSKRLCPALDVQPNLMFHVRAYEPWGVMGERAYIADDGELRRERLATVQYGGAVHTIGAKQLTVIFTDYEEVS